MRSTESLYLIYLFQSYEAVQNERTTDKTMSQRNFTFETVCDHCIKRC